MKLAKTGIFITGAMVGLLAAELIITIQWRRATADVFRGIR